MGDSIHSDGSIPRKCENVEEPANKAQTTQGEPLKPKLSKREELEAWQASREAKKAAAKVAVAAKTPAKKNQPYAIVPSSIHQKCKEHGSTAPAASSSATAALPPTPLHQHNAAQASKLLKAHTPMKTAPTGVPQTAPRPTAQKRSDTELTTVPLMMTPQAKPKFASKTTAATRPSLVQTSSTNTPMLAPVSSTPASNMVVSEPEGTTPTATHLSTIPTPSESIVPNPVQTEPKVPTASEKRLAIILNSVTWNGIVDAFAIKLLEGILLRKCISIVRVFCPRADDDANSIMEKYVSGKKQFALLEKSLETMTSLMSRQQSQGMTAPKKPFKTATFFLYRALFEEYHEQIPEATACFEAAVQAGAEPKLHVLNAFRHFCGRIRELTQSQMSVRQSLAIGVRRMQTAEGLVDSETTQDAQAMVALLEDDEFEDVSDAGVEEGDQFEEESLPEEDETIDAGNDDESLPSEYKDAMDIDEEAENILQEVLSEERAEDANTHESLADDQHRSPSPVPASERQVCSFRSPVKLEALTRTPLGKPKRQIVFGDREETADAPVEIPAFSLVYETSKPSRKTKKEGMESETVVTPMRRSNRIAQPLRAGQSVDPSELLPESNWAYQPNEELISSGQLDSLKSARAKPTPQRRVVHHFVPMSVAEEKLAQINDTPHKTPSRMGPPRRVPVSFDDEFDDDNDDVLLPPFRPTCAQTDVTEPIAEPSEVTELAQDLKSIGIPVTQVESRSDDKPTTAPETGSTTETAEEAPTPVEPTEPVREMRYKRSKKSETPSKASRTPVQKSSATTRIQHVSAPVVTDSSSAAQEEQSQSLYTSMRKAAYSGTYGSGYVVTPAKNSTDDSNDSAADATPSRRSRRLANKK